MDIRRISDRVSVSPQISIGDVGRIREKGFVAIVNNRPDGEEESQPWNEDIEAEAKRLGLSYHFVPVGGMPFSLRSVARMADILEAHEGPVFLFCRTGTRCANIWALSQAGRMPGRDIIAAAARAGYDVSGLAEQLENRPRVA